MRHATQGRALSPCVRPSLRVLLLPPAAPKPVRRRWVWRDCGTAPVCRNGTPGCGSEWWRVGGEPGARCAVGDALSGEGAGRVRPGCAGAPPARARAAAARREGAGRPLGCDVAAHRPANWETRVPRKPLALLFLGSHGSAPEGGGQRAPFIAPKWMPCAPRNSRPTPTCGMVSSRAAGAPRPGVWQRERVRGRQGGAVGGLRQCRVRVSCLVSGRVVGRHVQCGGKG